MYRKPSLVIVTRKKKQVFFGKQMNTSKIKSNFLHVTIVANHDDVYISFQHRNVLDNNYETVAIFFSKHDNYSVLVNKYYNSFKSQTVKNYIANLFPV